MLSLVGNLDFQSLASEPNPLLMGSRGISTSRKPPRTSLEQ